MPTIGALLLRNEGASDRYLRRVLANVTDLCDGFVVVDDGSTDDTVAICKEFGGTVVSRESKGFWGTDETSARAQLWDLATRKAGPDGWVYIADGDHELIGVTRDDMKALTSAEHVQGWATVLYDCWNDDQHHRIDTFWQAWRTPRPWIVKAFPHPDFKPGWARREIHAGHLPANWSGIMGVLPATIGIRHLGYVSPTHRLAKAQKYLRLK